MSDTHLHVKPAAGLVVRDPDTAQALPAKGGKVANNSYWRRRVSVGDVIPLPAATQAHRKDTKSEA